MFLFFGFCFFYIFLNSRLVVIFVSTLHTKYQHYNNILWLLGSLKPRADFFRLHNSVIAWVRIKRGYGRTDEWRTDGRTDGRMSGGRTDIINSCETCFPSHIRVLSKRIKRGYGIENAFRAIPSHIRVLS